LAPLTERCSVQRTSNIYRLVTLPSFYKAVQGILGTEGALQAYVDEMLKPVDGMKVLDCGCGPASIVRHLPNVDYTGIDINPSHIAYAKQRFGPRGRFIVGDVTQDLTLEAASFDLVMVSSLLHHLDDDQARRLLISAVRLMKIEGRIVTVDSIWLPGQHPIAWLLNKLDSGLNVRAAQGYLDLVEGLPVRFEVRTFHNLFRVPYDHFCMTLTRAL
jgi:SAM-dependent methyltransferase